MGEEHPQPMNVDEEWLKLFAKGRELAQSFNDAQDWLDALQEIGINVYEPPKKNLSLIKDFVDRFPQTLKELRTNALKGDYDPAKQANLMDDMSVDEARVAHVWDTCLAMISTLADLKKIDSENIKITDEQLRGAVDSAWRTAFEVYDATHRHKLANPGYMSADEFSNRTKYIRE